MAKRNFLLGKGERLAEDIHVPSPPVDKKEPYTFEHAKERLLPMVRSIATAIDLLPPDACPDDLAVASLTLNPEYIAKSYFPSELLRAVGLQQIGSRPKKIKPEKRSGDREPIETITTEMFVIGKRSSFQKWADGFADVQESDPGAAQLRSIEQINVQQPADKLRMDPKSTHKNVLEIVLHLDEQRGESRFLSRFRQYLQKRYLTPQFDRRFYAGGLCFLEMEAAKEDIDYIAEFSLVRVIRSMPSLRLLRPPIRISNFNKSIKMTMPRIQPLDPKIKVAIFDGGIPDRHPILQWAHHFDVPGIGQPVADLLAHGVGVTAAFLFGHIDPKVPLPQPYAYVDHYRVIDNMPGRDPYELFEILDRIKDVLDTHNYDFFSLSLGPEVPIEDDEVHTWTAVLDEYLSKNKTLALFAVGNEGEGDPSIGANRVMVPADCVNALGIGACDVPGDNWVRAPYSSVGPGRSPGITKPDLVEFGGSTPRPFLTLDHVDGTLVVPTGGTSFSTPATMRMAVGIKAHFGNALGILAIRTLLVHCAEPADLPREEIGFGRVARLLDDIVVCEEGTVRIVFQGRITASKFIRIPVPVPSEILPGKVNIKATLCYITAVDSSHPENYTRSGLEVSFRPDKDKRNIDKASGRVPLHPATKPFFSSFKKGFATELELRRDALKWENTMHASHNFYGKSLNNPAFDIHYNARKEGHNDTRSQEIEYALVISVTSKHESELYDKVVRKYATTLEQLIPTIEIPIRI